MRNVPTILTAAALLASAGIADARPDTRAMTCAQTRAMIQSRHAAVLSTGPNTYDRFVRQFGNECDWPEVPISVTVPTKDGRCSIYRCGQPVLIIPD